MALVFGTDNTFEKNYETLKKGVRVKKAKIVEVIQHTCNAEKNQYGSDIKLDVIVMVEGGDKPTTLYIQGNYKRDAKGTITGPVFAVNNLLRSCGIVSFEADDTKPTAISRKDFATGNQVQLITYPLMDSLCKAMLFKEIKFLEYVSGTYTGNDGNTYPSYKFFRTYNISEIDAMILKDFEQAEEKNLTKYTPEVINSNKASNGIGNDSNPEPVAPNTDGLPF